MSEAAKTINRFGIIDSQFIPEEARPEFGGTFDASSEEFTAAVEKTNAQLTAIRSSRDLTPQGKIAAAKAALEAGDKEIDTLGGKRLGHMLQELAKAKRDLPGPIGKPDPAVAPVMAEVRQRLLAMPLIEREGFCRNAAKDGNVTVVQAVIHDPMREVLPQHMHDSLHRSVLAGLAPEKFQRVDLLEGLLKTQASNVATAHNSIRGSGVK